MFKDDVPPLQRIYCGSRMAFLVLSRGQMGSVVPNVAYLVISITDPEQPDAIISPSPLCRAILRLKFHDTSQTVNLPGLERAPWDTEAAMTTEDAHAILTFVASYAEEVQLIVCQCEAGVSRSAGIAAALSRVMQEDDEFFFTHYWPNRHVYKLLLQNAKELPGPIANLGPA